MAEAAERRRRLLEAMEAPVAPVEGDRRARLLEAMAAAEPEAPTPPPGILSKAWGLAQAIPGVAPAAYTATMLGKVVMSHPGRKLLGALGETVDTPRQARDWVGWELGTGAYSAYDWVQGLFGGQTEKEIRGSLATGKIGWREAWRAVETGGKIIEKLAPGYAKRNPWKTKWLWGLGHEIITDPLNVMSFFALTKAGRALEGTAGLARTFAAQAKLGQRALLQVTPGGPLVWVARRFMPKAARFAALPRRTLIAGPRIVGLVGTAGRWVRHPMRMARGEGAVIDAIKFAQDVAAPKVVGEAGMELLKVNDALRGLQKGVDPDTWTQVLRAGEHIGKHPMEFAQYSDEVKALAKNTYALVGEGKRVATAYGIIGPEATELGNFHRAVAMLDRARGKEVIRLSKELMPHVGALEAKSLQKLAVKQGIANSINDELVTLADNLYDEGLNFIGTVDDLRNMRELNRAATKAQRSLASTRYRALQLAEWKESITTGKVAAPEAVGVARVAEAAPLKAGARVRAADRGNIGTILSMDTATGTARVRFLNRKTGLMTTKPMRLSQLSGLGARPAVRKAAAARIPVGKPGVGIPLTKKIERYTRDIQKVEKAMANQPNWMPHVLTEKGLRKVVSRGGGWRKNMESRMWNDQYNGFIQRRFVEDVVLESKTVMRAGRRVPVKVKRWLSLDEIDNILKDPKVGTKAEAYASELSPHLAAQGGIWGAIERRLAKHVKPLKGFFEMDPTKAFARTNNQILYAIRGKAFLQSVLGETVDLVSKQARPGWWKLREVSAALANTYGDVSIHPELGMELSRVYKQMFQPESLNTLVRVFDKATRAFKRSVTEPWASYHVRNAYSDTTLMFYNGDVDIATVVRDGYRGVFKKGKISTSLYGDIPAEELNRAARSYGVLFGEQVEAGSRGWLLIPENMRRMGYFADRLKRGRSFFQAAMDTKKVLFDYSQLSDFERNYMKRIIPFWSWLRNNLRRQFSQLATDPAIVAHQMRLTQRTEVMEGVDSWTRNRGMIAMNPDEQTGEERLLVGLDFPMMDVAQLLDGQGGWQPWLEKAAFRLNPLLKLGFRGEQFITGRGYFERPKVTSSFVKSLPEPAKKLLGVRREVGRFGVYWTINPRYDYLLKNLPTARFYSTARQLAGKPVSPEWRFLGVGEKGWAFLTGIREHRYRPAEVAERKRRSEAQELLRSLRRRGDVGELAIPYRRPGAEISPSEFGRIKRAAERR